MRHYLTVQLPDKHPSVAATRRMEVHFFDINLSKGNAWNVSEAVDPPKRASTEHQALTPEEVRRFHEAAQEDRLEAL